MQCHACGYIYVPPRNGSGSDLSFNFCPNCGAALGIGEEGGTSIARAYGGVVDRRSGFAGRGGITPPGPPPQQPFVARKLRLLPLILIGLATVIIWILRHLRRKM